MVPFERHTFTPFTVREEDTFKFVPVAFTKVKVSMVPELERRVVIFPLLAMRLVPERFVAKRLVPVAPLKNMDTVLKFVMVPEADER